MPESVTRTFSLPNARRSQRMHSYELSLNSLESIVPDEKYTYTWLDVGVTVRMSYNRCPSLTRQVII